MSETASVLFCLHLLYEDLKLDVSFWSELSMMAKMLAMLSADLQLDEYLLHYWQDFPLIVSTILFKNHIIFTAARAQPLVLCYFSLDLFFLGRGHLVTFLLSVLAEKKFKSKRVKY